MRWQDLRAPEPPRRAPARLAVLRHEVESLERGIAEWTRLRELAMAAVLYDRYQRLQREIGRISGEANDAAR